MAMEVSTRVRFKMEMLTGSAFLHFRTSQGTRGSGTTENTMDMAHSLLQMEPSTPETGWQGSTTELVFLNGLMEVCIKESGKTAESMAGESL